MPSKYFVMKHITLLGILIFVNTICIGQNHLFNKFENEMNQVYGYNGPPVQVATQGAFDILYKKFGRNKNNRTISFNVSDWPSDVSRFIRIDYDNIPLLNQSNLKGDNLKVIGFTKTGELLQFIEYRQEGVKIERPGGWRLRSYGDWYHVKTLNGESSWIFGKPFGLEYAYASVVEKVNPMLVANSSETNSSFPFGTTIILGIVLIGIVVIVSSLSSSTPSAPSYGSGSYSSYSDSSYSSYSSEYDSNENSVSDSNLEIPEEYYTNSGSSSRCKDCQSIDLSGWGLTSKGNGRCRECNGSGHDLATEALVQFFTLGLEDDKRDCNTCYGTGQCQSCGGTGIVYD